MTLLIAAVPLVLAALAGAQRPGGIATPLLATPLITKLNEQAGKIRQARAARCLSRPHFRWHPGYRVPAHMRAYVVNQRRERLAANRARPSACVPHRALWECIHSREGSWTDPNPPYFGGLQMGYWFMGEYGDRQTYGRAIYAQEGTADNWSALEQMGVAAAAYREEGYSRSWLFGQWPNTAPPCAGYAA